jgi:hypothetical protein
MIRGSLSFFGNAAYDNERGWHELLQVILFMAGQTFRSEDCSSRGRSDLLLFGSPKVSYIIEFKIVNDDFFQKMTKNEILEKLEKYFSKMTKEKICEEFKNENIKNLSKMKKSKLIEKLIVKLNSMTKDEAQTAMGQVAIARNSAELDEATKARLKVDFDRLKNYLKGKK